MYPRVFISMAVLTAAAAASPLAFAQSGGGTLNFTGTISDSTCVVNASSISASHPLISPAAQDFANLNDEIIANHGFDVSLSSCTPGSTVFMTFDPSQSGIDRVNGGLVNNIDGTTTAAAEGLVLDLHSEGAKIRLHDAGSDATGRPVSSSKERVADGTGNVTFPLSAYYRRIGTVKPGQFAAQVTFNLGYR